MANWGFFQRGARVLLTTPNFTGLDPHPLLGRALAGIYVASVFNTQTTAGHKVLPLSVLRFTPVISRGIRESLNLTQLAKQNGLTRPVAAQWIPAAASIVLTWQLANFAPVPPIPPTVVPALGPKSVTVVSGGQVGTLARDLAEAWGAVDVDSLVSGLKDAFASHLKTVNGTYTGLFPNPAPPPAPPLILHPPITWAGVV